MEFEKKSLISSLVYLVWLVVVVILITNISCSSHDGESVYNSGFQSHSVNNQYHGNLLPF